MLDQETAPSSRRDALGGRILIVDDDRDVAHLVSTVLEEAGHEVKAINGDKQLRLTPTEFKLLRTLAGEPGRVFTRDDLLVGVWSYEPGSDTRLVDVHVGRLRKKLEQAQVSELSIETARGFGYRLIERPN